MGALIRRVPHLLTVVEIAGAAFLLGYGALALRRALRPSTLDPAARRRDVGSGRGHHHDRAAPTSTRASISTR